jgi:hypothetical protein
MAVFKIINVSDDVLTFNNFDNNRNRAIFIK